MMETFTQNDLIRYLYHETSNEENQQLERRLALDGELNLRYQDLKSLMQDLDAALLEPSANCVNSILRSLRVDAGS